MSHRATVVTGLDILARLEEVDHSHRKAYGPREESGLEIILLEAKLRQLIDDRYLRLVRSRRLAAVVRIATVATIGLWVIRLTTVHQLLHVTSVAAEILLLPVVRLAIRRLFNVFRAVIRDHHRLAFFLFLILRAAGGLPVSTGSVGGDAPQTVCLLFRVTRHSGHVARFFFRVALVSAATLSATCSRCSLYRFIISHPRHTA